MGVDLFHWRRICFMETDFVSWGLKVQNISAMVLKCHEDQWNVVTLGSIKARRLAKFAGLEDNL